MTISTPATSGTSHPTATPPGLPWWQAILAGAAAATAVNLILLFTARALDASLVLGGQGGPDQPITVGGVVVSSTLPLAVGILLAVLISRWWPGVLRLAQVVGGALALLSVAGPVISDTDGGTRLTLATMHVVVGVAVVLALEAVRRRRAARPAHPA